ncbi:MAG: LLM class flavin-dependent oxidoreductase, partial [Gammaproteobacteria bacterium]|nr:LLM class flavin-dependent oxidoreductase [Gammaproteobacteria bacterium]
MKFGLFNLMTVPDRTCSLKQIIDETVTQVRMAEQLDFDVAWFAEHHFSNYSMCPSPLMMASYCAPQTDRIRLGAAVLVLPLYHPIRMIEEIALLDIQSNGRAVIGLGSGYQEYEFSGFGLDIEDKLTLAHEIWDIMEMGLTQGEIAYEGKHFKLPKRSLTVRCIQQPMPDVFVAGVNPGLVERVARSGYTPFVSTGFRGVDKLMDLRSQVEKSFGKVAATHDRIPLAIQRYVYITDSREDALDAAECARFVGRTVANMVAGTPQLDGAFLKPLPFDGEPSLEEIVENLNIGDPETVAEKIINEVRIARPTHYSCFFRFGPMDGKRALRSIERFGSEVLP